MSWWRKEKLESTGSVLYRGAIPPRANNYAYLADLDVELREVPCSDDAHWQLAARHSSWGTAEITCLRNAPVPEDLLIDSDPRLLPSEREIAKTARSSLTVAMEATAGNVLAERKQLLRYLRVLMNDDGVVAVDLSR